MKPQDHITVGFWCQLQYKKILQRFDTSFEIKMMAQPIHSERLVRPGQLADKSERACGI